MMTWHLGRMLIVPLAIIVSVTTACGPGQSALEDKAEFHYKLAKNYFGNQGAQRSYQERFQDIESAVQELYSALEYSPKHAKSHHLLGFIYFGRRDHVRALKHFQESIAIDPYFDEAYANLGTLYLAMEQWKAAVAVLDHLLTRPLYRTKYLTHNNIGWAHYNLNAFDKAKHHYDMAIFLNPKMCLAHNNVGRLHADLGAIDLALEHFHKAIELCAKYQEPHYFLGRIYAALSAPEQARKHFQRCYDLKKDAPFGRRCGEAL